MVCTAMPSILKDLGSNPGMEDVAPSKGATRRKVTRANIQDQVVNLLSDVRGLPTQNKYLSSSSFELQRFELTKESRMITYRILYLQE